MPPSSHSPLLLAAITHLPPFSVDLPVLIGLCRMWLLVSDLFHLMGYLQGLSALSLRSVLHSLLRLSTTPAYTWTPFYPFLIFEVVFISGCLKPVLLPTVGYTQLFQYLALALWNVLCHGVVLELACSRIHQLVSHRVPIVLHSCQPGVKVLGDFPCCDLQRGHRLSHVRPTGLPRPLASLGAHWTNSFLQRYGE